MPESRQVRYQTGDDGGDLFWRAKRLRAELSGFVSGAPASFVYGVNRQQGNFSVVFDPCICYFWTEGETYSGPKRIEKVKGIPLAKDDDQILIEKALAGNEGAYRLLLTRHKDAIYRMIVRIVHNQEEAQDLVQETFMKAFGSLSSYKCQYRFTTWLYKIAANSCIDHLRKRRLVSVSLDQPLKTKDGEVTIEVADWTYNPEQDLTARQKSLSIDAAIDSLPKKYREVILYRHKQDKSYDEIAQILSIPVGTVKARIFRARELLKKRLKALR